MPTGYRSSYDYTQSATIQSIVRDTVSRIKKEVMSRAYRASNELVDATSEVLRGQRSGRRYKIPGTYAKQRDAATGERVGGVWYTASAPGEPPAVRTGMFRASWKRRVAISETSDGAEARAIAESNLMVNGHLLGAILEFGRPGMAPRPYRARVKELAMQKISAIYRERYR